MEYKMKLSHNYRKELTPLAFSEIPKETLIEENFMQILKECANYRSE